MSEPKNKLKILLLYNKYRLQKDLYDPEAENTLNLLKAEENEVHDLDSFIDEIKYRWNGNPWLGGYNKTLDMIFSGPSSYDTFKDLAKPSTYRNLYDTFKLLIKSTKEPTKKQLGGQLNMNEQELQLAFIQFLAQKTGAKDQQELESAIQQLGEEGLKLAYAEFMNLLQLQQVQAAKFGAKLNYIKSLRGQCPEGYELSYYKVGGTLCKKCMKKQQAMEDGGQIPQNPIDQFKCGRKMKKKTNKKENGGELNSTKNPQVFSKMTLAKCGTKLKEACKKIDANKCGKKLKKKCELGGPIKNKRTLPSDRATRDSIAVNKYNDQTIQTTRPGTYKKNSLGQIQWTPDRSKYPYRKLPNKK